MNATGQRAKQIFVELVGHVPPEQWDERLAQACGDDANLLRRVRALLHAHRDPDSFLDQPSFVPDPQPTSYQLPVEVSGTQIGPYKLLQQIGEGGMGTVFMAEQSEPVQRRVAVKIIKPGMDSRQVIARFAAEKQALALMDHVNIARVLDAGTTGGEPGGGEPGGAREPGGVSPGRPYFVMELVHGIPITKYCDDNHLTPRQRLELFVPVCQAIQHAHQKGIIHRDIKPSNVMITLYDGKPVPKVIDFGVAKATEQKLTEQTLFTQYGTMVGTLEYMSPEQAEMSALGVDTRSDIYSLGVLLYELLTGSTPLSSKQMKEAAYGEILRLIREEEPPKPSTRLSDSGEALASISAQRQSEPARLMKLVRGELDWIVMKCLEKDRNRRYDTANSLAADVRRYLDNEAVLACPPSAWYRFRKFARRNMAALVTACAVGVAALVAVAALATSTLLIADAKEDLRQDSYFHRIALAHRELSANNNLRRALELLKECPEDLRDWEWHYLMRLCRVEPLVIPNKIGPSRIGVNSITFSADGEVLASAGSDGAVKILNSRTGELIQPPLKAHSGTVSCVAFHPDGKHVASVGMDGQVKSVKVWDLTTREAVFTGPCDSVYAFGTAYAAAFSSPDGRHLAAGSAGDVQVWDWKSGQILHTLRGQDKHRVSVAFSHDGRRLASGSWGGSVKLWDVKEGGEPLRTFPETTPHPVGALAFNKDGDRLATATFGRRVEVWDTKTGKLQHTLVHGGTVLGVAFSPNGRRLASTGEDKTVRIWDTTTGREVLSLRGHTGLSGCVAFSHGRLASASLDGTIRVWDATPLQAHEGQETPTLQHSDEVWSVAVSPDGQKIVSAGMSMPARVWDARIKEENVEFSGHKEIVFCVAWQPAVARQPDHQRVATAGGNGDLFTVKVWDPRTGNDDFMLPALSGEPEFFAVAFSPDGQHLVTGSMSGAVQVWDARTGKSVGTLGTHARMVRGVAFSGDGQHLASVSGDGKVKLWDGTRLAEKQESSRLTLDAFSPGQCLNIAFSPDGRRLATGGEESTVKIWDVSTGKVLHTLRGHTGDIYSAAFSLDPSGRWLASAGEDSTVKIWDSHAGGVAVGTFRGHMGLVSSLAFIPDGRLVSGSRDRTVKIWDLKKLNELSENVSARSTDDQ